MAEDLFPAPLRFHREVALPDVERIVGSLERKMEARFAEVAGHLDAICQRFDNLEARLGE